MGYQIVTYTEKEDIFFITDLERDVFFEVVLPEDNNGAIKYNVLEENETIATFEKPIKEINGAIVPKTLTEIIEEIYYGRTDESGGR